MRFFAQSTRRLAMTLGLGGLIPFVIATIVMVYADPRWASTALEIFIIYSALIVSFLGGIQWGAAIGLPRHEPLPLALSVTPMLLGFAALLTHHTFALPTLILAHGWAWWCDRQHDYPRWFFRLRTTLSLIVIILHIIALIAVVTR